MDPDQEPSMEEANACIERTIRNLNSEKLALSHKVTSLENSAELHYGQLQELTYENEKLKEENLRLERNIEEYAEKQETVEILTTAQEYKLRVLQQVVTKQESTLTNMNKKIDAAEAWSNMCKQALTGMNIFKEQVQNEKIYLKQQIESLEKNESSMTAHIQSLVLSEKALKQKLLDETEELSRAILHQANLTDQIRELKSQNKDLSAARVLQTQQLQDLEAKSETLIQNKGYLEEFIQQQQTQMQDLAAEKQHLQANLIELQAKAENLVADNSSLQEQAHSLSSEIDVVNEKLEELKKAHDLQHGLVKDLTASKKQLLESKELLSSENSKLIETQNQLKDEIQNAQTQLNASTLSNLKLVEDLQQYKEQILTVTNKQFVLSEENEALNLKIRASEESHERDIELYRIQVCSLKEAEDILQKSLSSLQEELNMYNMQIEQQTNELKANLSSITSLQQINDQRHMMIEELEKELMRLRSVDLQNLEELQNLRVKCDQLELLTIREENLRLENEQLKQKMQSEEISLDQLQVEMQFRVKETEQLQVTIEKLEQDLQEKITQLQRMEEINAGQNQSLGSLKERENNQLEENHELKNQLTNLQSKIADMEENLAKSLVKIEELKLELQRASEVSFESESRHTKLMQNYQDFVKTSNEKEHQQTEKIAELQSLMSAAQADFKREINCVKQDLDVARTENENLQSFKERLEAAEKVNKNQKNEIALITQEKKRLADNVTEARSHVKTLNNSLTEKQLQLAKIMETQQRLMNEKEQYERQLTSYMAKNSEQDGTIRQLKQDIQDMIAVNEPLSKNPIKSVGLGLGSVSKSEDFCKKLDTETKEKEKRGSKKNHKVVSVSSSSVKGSSTESKLKPVKTYTSTPIKNAHSTPLRYNSPIAVTNKVLSPILPTGGRSVFSDLSLDVSMELCDVLPSQAKVSRPYDTEAEKQTDAGVGSAKKGGELRRKFFRARPV